MKYTVLAVLLISVLLASCGSVDLNAPVPVFDTGADTEAWVTIPAGSFLFGQQADPMLLDYEYEIMVTDVTVAQYLDYLNAALVDGSATLEGNQVVGFYPGDTFLGAKHELRIDAGNYILVPSDDPASRFSLADGTFSVIPGWENHPMTNVSWFGALAYCKYHGVRLPSEAEWEKAARGSEDERPFPWGEQIERNSANYYASRDPFEDMSGFGSRTSPVGFYNGNTYEGYATLDGASPYGLYDMAGNVWQWVGDILPGFSDRFMHGGSKDTYDMDLRIWVRNSAPPTYYSPGVGFRCVNAP